MPLDDGLARTVIRMDEKASAERQALKRQILAAAETDGSRADERGRQDYRPPGRSSASGSWR